MAIQDPNLTSKQRKALRLKADAENAEAVLKPAADDPAESRTQILETTGFIDHPGATLLIAQTLQANQAWHDENKANGLLSSIAGIEPQNPLEGLLAAQMVTCHNLALEFTRRATEEGRTPAWIDENLNRANKMMRMFTTQVEALQKLRNKGQQRITVQHVQVNQGGQAVIGDVNQHGGG